MNIRLDRTKMAMAGNVCSYDLVIPSTEVDRTNINYFIVRDGKEYVRLADATRPAELDKLPRGITRYQRFMDHEKACQQWSRDTIRRYFPELDGISDDPLGLVALPAELSHHTIEANF